MANRTGSCGINPPRSPSVRVWSRGTGQVQGKTRYTISFFLDGRCKRRMFTKLEDAKREAKLVAKKN